MKLTSDKPAIKLPPQVSETVGKLRSSGLLVPIVLLVVAIVAAPILLSRSSGPAPAAIAGSAEAGNAEAGSSEFDPVVLTATPGLRDYRERLDPFSSKNPFRQQLVSPPKSAEEDTGGGGGGEGSGSLAEAIGGGTAIDEGSSATGGDPVPTVPDDNSDPAPVPDPDPTPVPDPGNGGNGNDGGTDDEPADPTKVSVRYGPAGNTQLLIDLKPVYEMAGPDEPLARLRRVTANAAVFGISPEVDLGGEGTCLNDSSPCNLLRIKVGQTAELTYRPTGETYRLQLLRVK